MKALLLDRFGSVDAFRVVELPRPDVKPGEVRVRVMAASINSWDWELARGDLVARFAAPLKPERRILGADIAGVVDAIGDGVAGLSVGQPVYGDLSGFGWGGFAEFVAAKAEAFFAMPADLDFVAAATLPQAGILALQSVRMRPALAGKDVLVVGGGGGVGTFAIQIAKAGGARVTAVDSGFKAETMVRAGADIVLDRDGAELADGSRQFDLVVDPVVRRGPAAQMRLLAPGGVYAMVGGRIGTILLSALFGSVIAPRLGKHAGIVAFDPDGARLAELSALVTKGAVRPIVERVYPLEEGVAALRHFAEGRARGKIVIAPAPEASLKLLPNA